jgi:ferredoxin
MAYKITEECIGCGACKPECKNGAINAGETYYGEIIYIINPDRCTECAGWFKSPRCIRVCPVFCCVPDSDHKETRKALINKWQKLHPGKEPAEQPD